MSKVISISDYNLPKSSCYITSHEIFAVLHATNRFYIIFCSKIIVALLFCYTVTDILLPCFDLQQKIYFHFPMSKLFGFCKWIAVAWRKSIKVFLILSRSLNIASNVYFTKNYFILFHWTILLDPSQYVRKLFFDHSSLMWCCLSRLKHILNILFDVYIFEK